MVELKNLPLIVKDLNSFTFDFYAQNIFYAIGATNDAFDGNESGDK